MVGEVEAERGQGHVALSDGPEIGLTVREPGEPADLGSCVRPQQLRPLQGAGLGAKDRELPRSSRAEDGLLTPFVDPRGILTELSNYPLSENGSKCRIYLQWAGQVSNLRPWD